MKRFYRSKKDRVLAGICGGIAEYFAIDPVIVRVIAVALMFMGGSGIIAYIIGIFIIPEAPNGEAAVEETKAKKGTAAKEKAVAAPPEPPRAANYSGALIIGIILIVIGGLFLMRNFPFFDND